MWVGEEDSMELKLITSYMTYYDGPNSVAEAEKDVVSLEKWSKTKKRYEKL